jgi:CBS domain containing-hemolysin-like protein
VRDALSVATVLTLVGVNGVFVAAEYAIVTARRAADRVGAIPRAQDEMLHAVFDFADLEAADVMVRRPM